MNIQAKKFLRLEDLLSRKDLIYLLKLGLK